jgi:hypothetical protein
MEQADVAEVDVVFRCQRAFPQPRRDGLGRIGAKAWSESGEGGHGSGSCRGTLT